MLLTATACNDEPEIVTYRVPKSRTGLEMFRKDGDSEGSGSKFATPEGWTRGKSSPMFPSDKFLKTVDNNEVVLSIMSLPAEVNDWNSNVVRWLGQVSMEKTSEEIAEMTTTVDVDGIESSKVRLIREDADTEAIIGIMAVKGKSAWFIKLMGKKAAVEATESEFDNYVTSLELP